MKLDWYRNHLKVLSLKKGVQEFPNPDKDHAIIALSSIIKNAETEVKIFAGNLSGSIGTSTEYRDSIVDFLDSNKKLKVILKTLPALSDTYFWLLNLSVMYPNSVEVKTNPDHFLDSSDIHVTISDGTHYRVETDIKEHNAFCAFNDPSFGGTLSAVFDTHWSSKKSTLIIS